MDKQTGRLWGKIIVLVIVLVFCVSLFFQCPAVKYANSGPLVAFEYYSSEGGGHHYVVYENPANADELLLSATYGGRFGTVVKGDASLLQSLQQIIERHGVQSWDKDKEVPFFSASALEYYLVAAYENAQICASSNISNVPKKYAEAHAEIKAYLEECAQTLPKVTLDKNALGEFDSISVYMPDGEVMWIEHYGEERTVKYNVSLGAKPFYAQGDSEALVEEVVLEAVSCYNSLCQMTRYGVEGYAIGYISFPLDNAALEAAKAKYDAMEYASTDIYYSIGSQHSSTDEYRELCDAFQALA